MEKINPILKKYKIEIDSAETLEKLAEVGISILKEMRASGKPIIYIAGPVSTGGLGDIEKNLARLSEAIKIASKHDLQVFDQAAFEGTMRRLSYKYLMVDGYYLATLELFYKSIFESGLISKLFFLPDWQSSKGATWERNFAKTLGIAVDEYPEEWLAVMKN